MLYHCQGSIIKVHEVTIQVANISVSTVEHLGFAISEIEINGYRTIVPGGVA